MSFLEGGSGDRIPTARTFLPPPPTLAQLPQGSPPPQAEEETLEQTPLQAFVAALQSLEPAAREQAKAFLRVARHREKWGWYARELARRCANLADEARDLRHALEVAPFPLRPLKPEEGVQLG